MNSQTLKAFRDELQKIAATFVGGASSIGSMGPMDHRFVPEGASMYGMQSSGSFQPIKFNQGGGMTIQGPSNYNEVPYGIVSNYTGVR